MQASGEAQVEDVVICYVDKPLCIQKYTWKRMAEATTKVGGAKNSALKYSTGQK